MHITTLSGSRIRVTFDDSSSPTLLGIDTGIPSGGFAAQKVSAVARRGGIIVRNGRSTPWRVRRIVDHAGALFLCGDYLEGVTIKEFLDGAAPAVSRDSAHSDSAHSDTAPPKSASPESSPTDSESFERAAFIEALADTMGHTLESGGYRICNTTTSLFANDGSILLIDADLTHEINRNLPGERRQTDLFPYRSSRYGETAAELYMTATIIWHAIVGEPPCRNNDDEIKSDACHAKLSAAPSIHRLEPRTHTAVEKIIADCIAAPSSHQPRELRILAEHIRADGVFEPISEAEALDRREKAEAVYERSARSEKRRTLLRTKGQRIAVTVLALLVVASVPFHILRNRLSPPSTAGLAPLPLVERFYEGWRQLDHMVMDEALARGVARGIVQEVTNVYVVDRVQLAHSMESRIMPAEEWIAAGRPADRIPYGPSNLNLTVLRQVETSATIIAEYILWRPAPPDTSAEGGTTSSGSAVDSEPSATAPPSPAEAPSPAGQDSAPSRTDASDDQPPPSPPVSAITRTVRRDRLTLLPTRWGWEIAELVATEIDRDVVRRE